MENTESWSGVFPATLCAFHENEDLDESGLRNYFTWLCQVDGVKGLVCNGHTGEIMALRPDERERVTKMLVEEIQKIGKPLKAITGVAGEGSLVAIDHALAAKEAGADAILLMPPHYQLRFGRSSETAVGFIQDVAEGSGMNIIVHQYPAWTRVGYSLEEMLQMVRIPQVVAIKMGTRDMARWAYDYEQIKKEAPHIAVLTCHDEYLLPTLVEAGDGALIGFAGFAPGLMVSLVHACMDGNLKAAREAQKTVAPLARLIYKMGEPGCGAHQRMKVALWLMGQFSSPVFRRPIRPLPKKEVDQIRHSLQKMGFKTVH